MRPFPLLGSLFALFASVGMATAASTLSAFSAEPPASQRPPVAPSWQARGWQAVVPHAYVLRKLLAVRSSPRASASAVFHLKGGTRVPVVEQGQSWWRISWTQGRTGWVPARDLEPHAAFVLIDTGTGKMTRRIAAKGQWGAISDGTALWSLADTGITRTLLADRPSFWARKVAADRDAVFPERSLWTADRSHFYLRTADEGDGALLRTNVSTGEILSFGTPPKGDLAGVNSSGELLLRDPGKGKHQTRLYSPHRQQTVRQVSAAVQAVSRAGTTYLRRNRELLRSGPDLHTTARVRLPGDVIAVCLSADERYLAASYEITEDYSSQARVRIMDAQSLRTLITLSVPAEAYSPAIHHFGKWAGGWWTVGGGWVGDGGEGQMEALVRYRKNGKPLSNSVGSQAYAISPDGKTVYLTDEDKLLRIDTTTGKSRSMPFTWRRSLPARYLPRPTVPDFPTRLEVSALSLSPDSKTLILTEWLSGDPQG